MAFHPLVTGGSGPGSTTRRRRRFGIGLKFALVMALFLLTWAGHFSIGHLTKLDIQQTTQRVDDSGRLRMLSQRIAYLVSQASDPQQVDREALREAMEAYQETLARIESSSVATLLETDRDALRRAIGSLTSAWHAYRSTVEEVLPPTLSLEKLHAIQHSVAASANHMLASAEALVRLTVDAQVRAQRHLDSLRNGLSLISFVLMLGVGALVHRRIIEPLRAMAALARRCAAGDHSGRIRFDANDELGDLARALNLGNAYTEQLIRSLENESNALRRAELRHRTLLESAADAIVITDTAGRIQQVNRHAETLLGYHRDELIGMPVELLMPNAYRDRHRGLRKEYVAAPEPRPMGSGLVVRAQRKDGVEIPVEISLSPSQVGDEKLVIAVMRDISERKQAEATQARLTAVLDAATDLIAVLTPSRTIWYLNPAGRRLLGLPPLGPLGEHDWLEKMPPWAQQVFLNEAWPLLIAEGLWRGELALHGSNGGEIPLSLALIAHHNDQGELEYVSCIGRDITERKRYEAELQHQATHDQLTGLANRMLFQDRLEQAIYHAHRHQRLVAVLFVDLDNFKLVNDSLGHAVGDRLLRTIARRMSEAVREGDTVARHGGDEFAVVLDDLAQAEDAVRVVRALIEAISRPVVLEGQSLVITTSIGISLYPHDAVNAADLMMNADAALYRAKAEGRNRYCFYTADMNREAAQRLEIENGLRRALQHGQLALYYQPIVDADSGRISGAEALLRWHHPEHGLLNPAGFIDVAEETGQILQIGAWVLEQACRQAQRWREAGLPLRSVAVNVSAKQCRSEELYQAVVRALEQSGLHPECLELELTESCLMAAPEYAKGLLDRIRALGVRLVIDDFGVGYSSLGQLKLFRFDKVKIDRSFVRDISQDVNDAVIAAAIIGMAHTLGAKVVGEGVEENNQREQLQRFGCDELQGYLFSRPVPAPQFEALLRAEFETLLRAEIGDQPSATP